MGEITERLEQVAAARDAGGEVVVKKINRGFVVVNVVWVIAVSLGSTAFFCGRNMITREEADRVYVRRDVYARDYENTTKQLDNIERKIDKLTEVLSAHPEAR